VKLNLKWDEKLNSLDLDQIQLKKETTSEVRIQINARAKHGLKAQPYGQWRWGRFNPQRVL
jgi:hypothetical protein